ncbi:MAG: hypothetical protein KA004_10560 [Verrucomicrobiales bacterium]|nr:hypothetical protein [Verrucomicrobiales bacterium]
MRISFAMIASAALCTVGSALAASFTTGNFGAYNTNTGEDLVGQQGWTSPSYTDDLSISTGTGGSWNGNAAFRVGGLYAQPPSMNTDINHSHADNLAGTTFSVNFSIFNSQQAEFYNGDIANITDPAIFGGRDKFGWSIRDGSNNQLWRLAFEPATLADRMEIVWYDPSNTRNTIPPAPGWDIINGEAYTLNVTFTQSGANATFAATLNSLSFGGTLTGQGAAQIADFGADYDVGGGNTAAAGSNYMIFNQLTVIPEPTASVLAALGGLMLFGRRRAAKQA